MSDGPPWTPAAPSPAAPPSPPLPPRGPAGADGPAAANRRGIGFMMAAMAAVSVNDALVKWASIEMPVGQLVFLRGLVASTLVAAALAATGVRVVPRQLASGRVALRAVLDAVATLAYLAALFHLPIANATAIGMAAPLFITALAVAWFGVSVGTGRALAVGLGFVGVLMVIQPSPRDLNGYAWLCLLATVLNAVRDLVTLGLPREVPSLAVTFATAVAVTIAAGLLSLLQGWVAVTPATLAVLAAAAVFLALAYQLFVLATRSGDPSVVAPFRYSGLLMALLSGWIVWGEVPDMLGWLGIALVLATGAYLLRRPGEA